MSSHTPPPGPETPEPGSSDPVEYLDSGAWGPAPPAQTAGSGRGRGVLIGAGVAAGAALLGVGGWALVNFMSTGEQPAQALPADTLGYVGLDLDPNGGQKIEALRTLNKFEDFKKLGLDADDDIRKSLFTEVWGCSEQVFTDQIEPWLGDRAAVAVVPSAKENADVPVDPVLALQVTDEEAASAALPKLNCGDAEEALTKGVTVADGWALVGETQEITDRVSQAASDSPLAEDADFQHWTDQAGSAGIVSLYVAPDAGVLLADELSSSLEGMTGEMGDMEGSLEALRDFGGAAATVRFADGGLEIEAAADTGQKVASYADSSTGADLVRGLPGDTAIAVGLGLKEGWAQAMIDQLERSGAGGGADLIDQLEQSTGLAIPDDIESLLGDGFALSVARDADFDALDSEDALADLPLGLKVASPADDVQAVLDKLAPQFPPDLPPTATAAGDDTVISFSDGYAQRLADEGDLGDQDKFRAVLPEADEATSLLYLDLDAAWFDSLQQEAGTDLSPLSAFGVSAWPDDDVSHVKVRLTTD